MSSGADAQTTSPPTIPGTTPGGTIPGPGPTDAVIPKPKPPPPCTIRLEASVLFAFDDYHLSTPGLTTVEKFARARLLTRRGRRLRVEITGYTDSDGTPEYNQHLSEQRAEAVRDALVTVGVKPSRVRSRGLGATHPTVWPETTPEAKAINRRVEIQLRKSNGQPACKGGL